MTKPMFQILLSQQRAGDKCHPETPNFVPWDLIKDHQYQAKANHGDQSLEELHSRGGLDPLEFYAVYYNITVEAALKKKNRSSASLWLIELVKQYNLKK